MTATFKSGRGGKRTGAGRPKTGRKLRSMNLTDEEHEKVKQFVKQIKEGQNET
jgi:hypothetical protein